MKLPIRCVIGMIGPSLQWSAFIKWTMYSSNRTPLLRATVNDKEISNLSFRLTKYIPILHILRISLHICPSPYLSRPTFDVFLSKGLSQVLKLNFILFLSRSALVPYAWKWLHILCRDTLNFSDKMQL